MLLWLEFVNAASVDDQRRRVKFGYRSRANIESALEYPRRAHAHPGHPMGEPMRFSLIPREEKFF
jgi:hypothetical protein